ncbi:NADH:ubiquinone oxidoreductase subunit 11 or 4L (chain K) [Paenibacillus algorifonticola]|uniref:NADH:ubiquinone oxidoreductase subunit 11 or 4L (Chain K) n=1 Tax=Paenibacillus algorifonticola TaxID=684063 RepID=A0A1I2GE11_9BACL|nr:NADH-quinone oxidoreductase subunit K [Paenibacillus algorifonticola]SFF15438.1 NADH:ubiquinone oxidoreductase subunit 11 or 4L (chain K) [Paenibacillus algorifonticola]
MFNGWFTAETTAFFLYSALVVVGSCIMIHARLLPKLTLGVVFTIIGNTGLLVRLEAGPIALFQALLYVGTMGILLGSEIRRHSEIGKHNRAIAIASREMAAAVGIPLLLAILLYVIVETPYSGDEMPLLPAHLMMAATLMAIGVYGAIVKRNSLVALLCVSIILCGAQLNIAALSLFKQGIAEGLRTLPLVVFFAQASIGAAVLIVLYKRDSTSKELQGN